MFVECNNRVYWCDTETCLFTFDFEYYKLFYYGNLYYTNDVVGVSITHLKYIT